MMIRRFLCIVFAIILFLNVGLVDVNASSKVVKVADKRAKVYVSTSVKSKVKTTLEVGTRISVTSHNRSWDAVMISKKKYYVPKKSLVTVKESVSKKKEYIFKRDAKVYKSSNAKSKVFKVYKKGSKLRGEVHNNSWMKVFVGNGVYYIPKRDVNLINVNVPVVKKETMYLKVDAFIYSSPSTVGGVLDRFDKGTKVSVSRHNNSWHKVYVSGKVYYIPTRLLVNNRPAPTVINPVDDRYSDVDIPNIYRADGSSSKFPVNTLDIGVVSGKDIPVRSVEKFKVGGKKTDTLGDFTVVYDKGTLDVVGDFSWVEKTKGIDVEIRYGSKLDKISYRKMRFDGDDVIPINTEVVQGRFVVLLGMYYDRGDGSFGKSSYGWYDFEINDVRPGVVVSGEVNYVDTDLQALAQGITRGKTTKVAQSKAIYEWVARNVAYDIVELETNGAKFYSAEDTYKTRLAMCTGYANLSAALHRAIGIDAVVVYGYANGGLHAWNEVRFGDSWYFQDPTWASGYVSGSRFYFKYSERFFNVKYPSSHIYSGTYSY